MVGLRRLMDTNPGKPRVSQKGMPWESHAVPVPYPLGNCWGTAGQARYLQGAFVARMATLRQGQQANSCFLYTVKKLQRSRLLESV